MSARRVVEYLVVAGIVERKDSEASITSGSSNVGEVLQSFPRHGRPTVALPAGIELFCQPHGWEIVTKPQSPYFIPFVLTSETGTRLYCVSLNFYQPRQFLSPEIEDSTDQDVTASVPAMPQHRSLAVTQSVISNISTVSDDLDMHWDMDMMDGGIPSPKMEFEPVSLCAISVHPLFSVLKYCLCGLYASWINGEHVLEEVVAKMLSEIILPLSGTVTTSLGSLRELRLPSFDERTSLPLTITECINLLRSIGVHNLITLLSAILMDESVLFISSSYSALTGAVRALVCLVYPFVLPYSLVPIVPREILEYVQLPSTYIMGVPSQYSDELPEPLDVIQVFLDDGRVEMPQSTEILSLPYTMHQYLETALNRIINPRYEYRDSAFPPTINEQLPSIEYQDKQVRAAFLCTILSLIGDYYNHITILKLCPEPAIAFNKKSFIAAHKEDEDTVFTKMADSLVFQNFVQLKAVPYRICDYADDLMAELAQEDKIDLDVLYSTKSLSKITNKIANLLLCDKLEARNDITSLYDISSELLNSKGTRKTFPSLDAAKVDSLCNALSPDDDNSKDTQDDLCRMVPIVDKLKESHHKTMRHYSSAVTNEIELLKKCLNALFENKIYEARKYIPLITQSFKNDAVAKLFVPELVQRLTTYGGFLGPEQFDILVKLMNSAMVQESMAARLLPLSTAFYRELCPGTTQQAYSCMQNHLMWESKQFWRETMYKAIQTELVRIHTTTDEGEDEDIGPIREQGHFRRRLTQLSEEDDMDEEKEDLPTTTPVKKPASRSKSEPTCMSDSQPIRQRAVLQHSSSQHKLRITQRISLLSRSVKMRMRASTVMPGAAEGVAPPDAKPITVHEALEVLGTQQKLWNELPADKQKEMIKQEENAVFNQVVLFVSRVIWLRCPLELSESDPYWKTFTKDLTEFLNKLLRSIEVDVQLNSHLFGKIREMIEGLISLHIATLDNQRRNLKKLPNNRMKIIKPPILQGEQILADCVRTFLLPDGRDDHNLLPAEGYFFVTSYRLIFLGTPCDPSQPNTLVTRTMPVTALYQLKKIGAQALPSHGISIVEGLQLRSLTGQLIKIGFDDETAPNAKKLHQDIITRKYPRRVVLAVSPGDTAEGDGIDTTGQLKRFLSDTKKFNSLLMHPSPSARRKQQSMLRKSKVVRQGRSVKKSNSFNSEDDALSLQSILQVLSRTPVCQEYERMSVGDIKKEQDKSDHSIWRLSTVNAQYAVCSSYPAVVAVPSSISDDTVISLTNQFKESRFPVVTWRHPLSKAVLLRSSTFSESSAVSYHKGYHNDMEETIQGFPNGPVPTRGGITRRSSYVQLGGGGIYHASLDRLLCGIVMCVKSSEYPCSLSNNELFGSAGEFQDYISIDDDPPTPPQRTKRKVTITRSSQGKENLDYERGGFASDEPEGPTFSREAAHTSPDPLGLDQPPKKLQMRSDSSRGIDIKSPTHFSSLPTSPRDWVMVEALPLQMTQWKTSPVYIIADKDVLRKVPPTLYPNCTFLPVEGKQHKEIHFSFKKLMRACSPSSPGAGAFLGAIEDSEWLNQLSNLLQLAGAIVDLIDLQCSSVLVALENGWDYTAQVVSLAQLLLDPYYRTINGFRKLVEKDWLAFGHPFSQRNNLTNESVSQDVSPVFLQFLDCVHQVLMQFPVAFQFNDFYLRMMAYHSCSMRFHTFALNSDKERSERGWQDYHMDWTRSKNVRVEDFNSFWTFVDNICNKSMMFYNFNYSSDLSKDTTVLRPHSFVANLDVWSYYLENHLSQFLPYDPEFISHRNLTLSDIHHKFFNTPSGPRTWESLIPGDCQFMPLVKLIHQCVDVTNEIHIIKNVPLVMWHELLQDFEQKMKNRVSVQDEVDTLLPGTPLKSPITDKHSKVLHNKTSMAVLIKGRLSVEAERNFIHPHAFVQTEVIKKKECNFCKHRLHQKTAIQCTTCNGWYHHYCKNLVPYNCGVKKSVDAIAEEVKPEPAVRKRTGSSLFYIDRKTTTYEGYLYKKGKMVKSWRLRWFVLDLERKMLSYYDSQGDMKSKGSIDMSEVMSVHVLMNQAVYPSPALKAGEKGYFFQLVTQKRTYQLMSVQDAARHEWMSKLKQCARI